ncbi:hypothetical protein EV122DRAFT_273333 [Schizophyllum commune]
MDGIRMSYAQFMAPPPPYEAVAPPRASMTSESAPPYQDRPPQPIVAHDASNTARTAPGASTFTPTTAQKTVPLGLPSTPNSTVAARLPAYRRVGYGRYRTHPYRRPLERHKVDNEEDDMISELENITIMDVISTPEYLAAASYPDRLLPVLTSNPCDWETLTRAQRAARLSERIADIDAIMANVNVYGLNEVETRVIDFALFVRRNLAERREAELFTGNNLF